MHSNDNAPFFCNDAFVDEKVLLEKKLKAESYFLRKWGAKTADRHLDDFGQYCIEQWLRGRKLETSFEFLAQDYFRAYSDKHGKFGSVDLLSQPKMMTNYTEFNVDRQHGAESHDLTRLSNLSLLRDERLTKVQRTVLILHYEWGMNLTEIGDVLSLTVGRVSQILKAATQEQKERIKKDDAKI